MSAYEDFIAEFASQRWEVKVVRTHVFPLGRYYLTAHRGLMELHSGRFAWTERAAERKAIRWARKLNAQADREAAFGERRYGAIAR